MKMLNALSNRILPRNIKTYLHPIWKNSLQGSFAAHLQAILSKVKWFAMYVVLFFKSQKLFPWSLCNVYTIGNNSSLQGKEKGWGTEITRWSISLFLHEFFEKDLTLFEMLEIIEKIACI